jgi:hypothetical protein
LIKKPILKLLSGGGKPGLTMANMLKLKQGDLWQETNKCRDASSGDERGFCETGDVEASGDPSGLT